MTVFDVHTPHFHANLVEVSSQPRPTSQPVMTKHVTYVYEGMGTCPTMFGGVYERVAYQNGRFDVHAPHFHAN
jgi:hypothetical protein